MYQFYASGLLFGWIFPFVFLVAIWKGNSRTSPYIARMAAVGVVAVFVTSSFGNMLGDRVGGIGVGLLIALSLYGAENGKKRRQVRRIAHRRFTVKPFHPDIGLSGNLQSVNEE